MRRGRTLLIAFLLLAASEPALAESKASSKTQAAVHFERGLTLVNHGELEAAVDAFETAYRTSPHFSVLYNLGQAYVTLGRPLEAVRALEKYLREGGDRVEANRKRHVEELLALQRGRLGRIELDVAPADAEIFVDGISAGTGPLKMPLELGSGVRVIAARKAGFLARAQSIEVKPQETVQLSLRLEPEPELRPEPLLGQLDVRCNVPNVEIWIDGARRATTPVAAPLMVPTGTRSVRLSRPGYVAVEKSLDVGADAVARLPCNLKADPSASALSGRLKIRASDALALVYVDGEIHDGRPLPSGLHAVRVERSGFRTWSQSVSIEPGQDREIAVVLEPTADRLAEIDATGQTRRTWAIAVGAAGLALAGTATGIYVWNAARYEDWRADRDRVDAALGGIMPSPSVFEENRHLGTRAAQIQRADDLAIGMAVAGGGALITAGILWLTSPEAPKSAPRTARPSD